MTQELQTKNVSTLAPTSATTVNILERPPAQLQLLWQISQSILNSTIDSDQTLQVILDGCLTLASAEHGDIFLLKGNELVLQATTELDKRYIGTFLSIEDSVIGLAVRQLEPVLIPDVNQIPQYKPGFARKMLSELAVPLVAKGRAIGVLNVESPQLNAFTKADRDLLKVLADQAVIALRNARSYEELYTLREIDKAILNSTIDLKQTLDVILDGSLRLLNARYGNLLLLEGTELIIKATTTEPPDQELGIRLPIVGSVSGLPVLREETVVIPDVDQEPLYKRVLQAEYMRSEMAVPLKENGRTVGILNVESPTLNAFNQHDKELLETLAGQAAIAIKNAQSAKKLRALGEIDKAILNPDNKLNDILQIILNSSLQLIGAQYGNLLLVEGPELVIQATSVPNKELIGTRIKISHSVTGLAVTWKQTIIVPDTDQEPLYRRILTDEYMRSELSVPLLYQGNALGVINIESPRLNAFTESDKELLETLAGQAVIAVRIARSIEELQTLREIDRAILRSENSLEQTLQVIVDSIPRLVGTKYANISLVEGDVLVIKALTQPSGEEALGTQVKINDSVTGLAVIRKEAVTISDVDQEPLYKRVLRTEYMQSELAVPLMDNGSVMGVLNIDSPELNAFTRHDQELLETLAGQAAIAIKGVQNNEELRQAKTIKAIGDTANWLVHKIGNLAFNIDWPAERLENEITADNESAQEDLQMIRTAAHQIVKIKTDLLKPLQPPKLQPLMIGDILKGAITKVGIPNNITSIKVASDLPLVKADHTDLNEVFEELLQNALTALQGVANKKIEIVAYMCHDKDCVEIKFSDNGCGMSAEQLGEIWAIGYTTKRDQGGTGLGLYAVAQTLYKIKAQIFAESEVNKGTTFTLKIPIWKDENGDDPKHV